MDFNIFLIERKTNKFNLFEFDSDKNCFLPIFGDDELFLNLKKIPKIDEDFESYTLFLNNNDYECNIITNESLHFLSELFEKPIEKWDIHKNNVFINNIDLSANGDYFRKVKITYISNNIYRNFHNINQHINTIYYHCFKQLFELLIHKNIKNNNGVFLGFDNNSTFKSFGYSTGSTVISPSFYNSNFEVIYNVN